MHPETVPMAPQAGRWLRKLVRWSRKPADGSGNRSDGSASQPMHPEMHPMAPEVRPTHLKTVPMGPGGYPMAPKARPMHPETSGASEDAPDASGASYDDTSRAFGASISCAYGWRYLSFASIKIGYWIPAVFLGEDFPNDAKVKMLTQDFCDYLEYQVSAALSVAIDPNKRGNWCDGILLPESVEDYALQRVNYTKQIVTRAWMGASGQDSYALIIKFGKKAFRHYMRGNDLAECVPSTDNADWIVLDKPELL